MKFEKLKNVVEIKKGKKPSFVDTPDENSVRVLQIDDLRNDTNLKFTNDKAGVFAKEDDVLIAWDGANAGTIGYGKSGYIGSTIALLRKKQPDLYSTIFIGIFLQSQYQYLRSKTTGATIPHISRKALDDLEVPVIGVNDQLHIAKLLSKAESLISKRKESIRLLDEFLKSSFLEMFGDAVKNEKKWDKSELKNFAKVRIGPFGSLLHREDYVQNGVPLVNPSHIGEGRIFIDSDLTISKEKMKELSAYVMHEGDVVLGRRGEIGRCAVVTKKEDGYLCGTGSIYIRPTKELNPIFLYNIISSASMRKVLENSAKGITMKNLNSGIIDNLKIPVPPIEIQIRFAEIVEKTEILKVQYQQSLQELENLYGSLSQKAFKGELTTNAKDQKAVIQIKQEAKIVQSELTKQQAFLRKLMLASHIVYELCEEPTFGHTKLMKLLYLCEQAGGMALQTNYKKFAAGPFDGKTLTLIDKEFAKNKWFTIEKKSFAIGGQKREATVYKKTEKSLSYKKHFENYFASEAETINRLIELFRKEKTQTAEIVATLYFAWNELKTLKTIISDNSLIEGFYKFHPEKKKFTREQIMTGYKYMQTNELYPQYV